MRMTTEKIRKQVEALPDSEKLWLVDILLSELDKPDPEIDQVWAEEASRRWNAFKAGKIKAVPYHEVMKRFKR